MKRSGRGVFSLLGLSSLLLLACTMIVSNNLENVRCSDEEWLGPPACESNWFCRAGRCRPCAAAEACGDHLDNDCDALIDEGCGGAGSTSEGTGARATQAEGG